MDPLSPAQFCVVALCALMVGVTKTGVPGLGILVVPLMATVIPARLSTGVLLPMLLVGDVFAVLYYHRHAVWPHLVKVLPWAVGGIVLGYLAMGHVSDRQLRPIIGGVILLMLAVHALRRAGRARATVPTHPAFAATMGLVSGVTTMMANAAGPVMTIYLLAMRLPKNEFIGTGAWCFLVINALKVPFSVQLHLITRETLWLNLLTVPLILAGAWAGLWIAKKIPEQAFARLVQWLAAAAAVNLVWSALR